MGFFKKLFGKKKNEIHLSADEAFNDKNNIKAPEAESESEQSAAYTTEPETLEEIKAPEAGLPEADEETVKRLKTRLLFSEEKIENGNMNLRTALRELANAVSESEGSFEVRMSDSSIVRIEKSTLPYLTALPEELNASLNNAPAYIKYVLNGINQGLTIYPVTAGEQLEAEYEKLIKGLKQALECYTLTGENELYDKNDVLVWNINGETKLEKPQEDIIKENVENAEPEKPKEDASASEEAPTEAPVTEETTEDIIIEETPAETPEAEKITAEEQVTQEPAPVNTREQKSLEQIAAHGITLDASRSVAIDEEKAIPRGVKETLERAAALTAAALVASAYSSANVASPAARSTAVLSRYENLHGVKRAFTAKENAYLRDPSSYRHAPFVLKAEAAQTLIWALGLGELNWPNESADIKQLDELFKNNDINTLCLKAQPKEREELFDMYDLTTRLHAMCVRASQRDLKSTGLDADVIYERHYALNWLLGVGGFSSWDNIIPAT